MLADPELDIAGSDLVVVTRRHDVVVGRGGGDTTKACRGAAYFGDIRWAFVQKVCNSVKFWG